MEIVEEVEGEKEVIVEIGDQDHMIDQVHMIGQRVEKDLVIEIETVEVQVKIKTQEKRNNSGTSYSPGLFCDHCKMTNHDIVHCYKLQKTLKEKGVLLNEANKKDKDDQEIYQMLMDLKNYIDAKDPTN